MNSKKQTDQTPFIHTIPAGTYQVEIQKDQYQQWKKAVTIDPGKSVVFSDAVLFYTTPIQLTGDVTLTQNEERALIKIQGVKADVDTATAERVSALGFSDLSEIHLYQSGPTDIIADGTTDKSYILDAPGDSPLGHQIEGTISALYWIDKNTFVYTIGSELWEYSAQSRSFTLLLRQTAEIHSIAAHETGSVVYYTDADGVHAIERDGRDFHQLWNIVLTPNTEILTTRESGRIIVLRNLTTQEISGYELYAQNAWVPIPAALQ